MYSYYVCVIFYVFLNQMHNILKYSTTNVVLKLKIHLLSFLNFYWKRLGQSVKKINTTKVERKNFRNYYTKFIFLKVNTRRLSGCFSYFNILIWGADVDFYNLSKILKQLMGCIFLVLISIFMLPKTSFCIYFCVVEAKIEVLVFLLWVGKYLYFSKQIAHYRN